MATDNYFKLTIYEARIPVNAFYFFTSSVPATMRAALDAAREDARTSLRGQGAVFSVWRRVVGVPASVPEVGEAAPVVREEAA